MNGPSLPPRVRGYINLGIFELNLSEGQAKVSKKRFEEYAGRNVSPFHRERERCRNPWNGRCDNTDIALYIFHEGERLPICRLCWHEIADKDFEWGEDTGI